MMASDEAFLDEVEDFLGSCTLPAILVSSESDIDNKEVSPTFTNTAHTDRVVGIVSLRPTRSLRLDPATKREMEKAMDRRRRNTYRERRRIEREGLQKELERLTETLQRARDGEISLYASVWKKLAERQHVALLKAEAEQRQLCKSIDAHGALLQRFKTFVEEQLTGTDGCGDIGAIPYEPKRVHLEPSDDPIFAAYLDELAGVYAQTEETLHSGGLNSTEANWGEPSESWDKDPDTGYFLFRGKLTIPFGYRDICRSRWSTAPLYHRSENRRVYKDVGDPENTIALKFRITTRLSPDKIASVLQRLVLRRYEENGRMVIVWRLFTEGEGIFAGMHADETGWGVATPVKSLSETGTIMTTCVRNMPMHLSSAATRAPVVKQFAGKLVEWGSENNLKIMHRLKNLELNDG